MHTLVAFVFIAGGLWTFIAPKSAFKFKANLTRNLGIAMTAAPRAFKTIKYLGLVVAIVGFLLYFG